MRVITAGDIRAINHVKDIGINGFSVNGYYVPGLGGGTAAFCYQKNGLQI